MPKELEIVLDDRESNEIKEAAQFYVKSHQFSHFILKIERLPVCDIICRTKTKIGKTGIEIKRGGDFIDSIIDGRYPNQIINMHKSGFLDNLIFIFIGNIEEVFKGRRFDVPAYYGAVASLQTKYSVSVNIVPDDFHAVLLSFYIFKHSDLTPRIMPILRVKVDIQQRQMAFLSCIKGVTEKSAEKVLIEFTVPQLCLIKDPVILIEKTGIRKAAANAIINFFYDEK